jgi:hypothetical protein
LRRWEARQNWRTWECNASLPPASRCLLMKNMNLRSKAKSIYLLTTFKVLF